MSKIASFLYSVGFVLFTGMIGTGNAMATTPDGETPANEGVCDILIGHTPGLYGLCVAYCEAQDLDDLDKEPPRTKILENYYKKKQDGDPDMPCMQVPCPCWTDAELATIYSDGMAVCIPGTDKLQIVNTTIDIARQFAEADISPTRERCRYLNLNQHPPVFRSFSIEPDSAQSCYDAVSAACNTL